MYIMIYIYICTLFACDFYYLSYFRGCREPKSTRNLAIPDGDFLNFASRIVES